MTVVRIVDDADRAAATIAAGGRLERHSVVMVLDLAQATPAPTVAGFSVAPMEATRVREYSEVVMRAYPPEHPDHEPSDTDPEATAEVFLQFLRGEEIGPWIAGASLHATDADDRVVGALLINETDASDAIPAGPFVTNVCVDPQWAGHGLGSALLTAAVARLAELGWQHLSLVVTVGNPAQRVYERLGFRVAAESWRVVLPS